MITSLGTCGALYGESRCPGEVVVDRVGAFAEGVCNLCGLEFAAPIHPGREPEPEPDFLDEKETPWWQR